MGLRALGCVCVRGGIPLLWQLFISVIFLLAKWGRGGGGRFWGPNRGDIRSPLAGAPPPLLHVLKAAGTWCLCRLWNWSSH